MGLSNLFLYLFFSYNLQRLFKKVSKSISKRLCIYLESGCLYDSNYIFSLQRVEYISAI